MKKVRVGVAGYGVIGQRLADAVALQADMEVVGVTDIAPTLSVRALKELGMPYKLFCAVPGKEKDLVDAGIPVSGSFDDLLDQVDVMLDASPGGVGALNKVKYVQKGVKAIFQGGEDNSVGDVFFHGYANYEKGLGQDYLKLTSCNTTGVIRAIDCLDRAMGIERVVMTIMRRCADPGDTHRGYTNVAIIDPIPNHQALDLMTIMPHIQATGSLVHFPMTHGHIIEVFCTPKRETTKEEVLSLFLAHPRIRVAKIAHGFNANASFFRYARDLGHKRADFYEIGVWNETIGFSGKDLMFKINIPQESVVIPENIDGVRAMFGLQKTRDEGTAMTNKYLDLKPRGEL